MKITEKTIKLLLGFEYNQLCLGFSVEILKIRRIQALMGTKKTEWKKKVEHYIMSSPNICLGTKYSRIAVAAPIFLKTSSPWMDFIVLGFNIIEMLTLKHLLLATKRSQNASRSNNCRKNYNMRSIKISHSHYSVLSLDPALSSHFQTTFSTFSW